MSYINKLQKIIRENNYFCKNFCFLTDSIGYVSNTVLNCPSLVTTPFLLLSLINSPTVIDQARATVASLNLSKMLSWTKQREPVVQTCPFLNNKACWGFYTAASKSAYSGVTLGLLTSDYSTYPQPTPNPPPTKSELTPNFSGAHLYLTAIFNIPTPKNC